MKITVVGPGRWGSFIAWYLEHIGLDVTLYGREGSATLQQFVSTRTNGLLTLPESVRLTSSPAAIQEADILVISIGSQQLRGLLRSGPFPGLKDKTIVLCMKGLEIGTGKRLSQIASEELDPSVRTAVWIGPGHVQEFIAGHPSCMVIDSACDEVKDRLIRTFSSPLIRFYYGTDLLGNEIGAASKNVIGIAAGMLDGLGLSTLKGALMSRGTREIARLIKAMGGSELSAYGLCHLGDYEATVFSAYSHNRAFGEAFVKGQPYEKLAEGYYTVQAMMKLQDDYATELPICSTIYAILYEHQKAQDGLEKLFTRSLKKEF